MDPTQKWGTRCDSDFISREGGGESGGGWVWHAHGVRWHGVSECMHCDSFQARQLLAMRVCNDSSALRASQRIKDGLETRPERKVMVPLMGAVVPLIETIVPLIETDVPLIEMGVPLIEMVARKVAAALGTV